jgi:hypothetical protein
MTDQPKGSRTPTTDLPALTRQLREEAEKLPAPIRDHAVSTAEKVHEHAVSDAPDAPKMTLYLKSLEKIAELAPTVSAIMQALSNVGM